MRANLDATHGLIMAEAVTFALAEKIGKSDAHHLIEAASKKAVADKRHLRDALAADQKVTAHLGAEQLARLFEPMAYQGASQALIDRVLASLEHSPGADIEEICRYPRISNCNRTHSRRISNLLACFFTSGAVRSIGQPMPAYALRHLDSIACGKTLS